MRRVQRASLSRAARNEAAAYADLAERAGVIAKRLLAERGLIYLEDLDPDTSREVLRAAWQQAARERFPEMDIVELVVEIDAMIDSLIIDVPLAGDVGAAVH